MDERGVVNNRLKFHNVIVPRSPLTEHKRASRKVSGALVRGEHEVRANVVRLRYRYRVVGEAPRNGEAIRARKRQLYGTGRRRAEAACQSARGSAVTAGVCVDSGLKSVCNAGGTRRHCSDSQRRRSAEHARRTIANKSSSATTQSSVANTKRERGQPHTVGALSSLRSSSAGACVTWPAYVTVRTRSEHGGARNAQIALARQWRHRTRARAAPHTCRATRSLHSRAPRCRAAPSRALRRMR